MNSTQPGYKGTVKTWGAINRT